MELICQKCCLYQEQKELSWRQIIGIPVQGERGNVKYPMGQGRDHSDTSGLLFFSKSKHPLRNTGLKIP